MATPTPKAPQDPDAVPEPCYGGYTRFELELEVCRRPHAWCILIALHLTHKQQFVQSLSNPFYLQHLAVSKTLGTSEFVAYLNYLQYFKEPKYARYLSYPGPTLRTLELLQQEQFRKDVISPELVFRLLEEGVSSATSERP